MIHFYTGKNGSGKSRLLLKNFKDQNNSMAIINTPFSKFGKHYVRKGILHISPRSNLNTICQGLIKSLSRSNDNSQNDVASFLNFLGIEDKIGIILTLDEKNFKIFSDNSNYLEHIHDQELHNKYSDIIKTFQDDYDIIKIYLLRFNSNNLELNNYFDDEYYAYNNNFFTKKNYSSYSGNLLNQQSNIPFLKYLDILQHLKIVKNYKFIFKKNSKNLYLSDLSSGEQTLLAMYFYILTHSAKYDHLFIDEPENSLHPEWQFSITTLIYAAIGYSNPRLNVYIATHSPLVISGGLSEYKDKCEVYIIEDNDKKYVPFHETNTNYYDDANISTSLESILWYAYKSSPPANHHLSIQLNNLVHQYLENNLSKKEVESQLENFRSKILIPKPNRAFEKNNKQIELISLIEKNLDHLNELILKNNE